MPHPFPSSSHDWPGASLVRQVQQQRQRRRANRRLAEALTGGGPDEIQEIRIVLALDQGADPNHPSAGTTPLRAIEWAVAHRRFELVTTLLDRGADPTATRPHRLATATLDLLYQRPVEMGLFAASVVALGDALKLALRNTPQPDGMAPATVLAALTAFLERGANPWRVGEPDDPKGTITTPLHLLAMTHTSLKDVPTALLRALDPGRTDAHGNTAAHLVARHGDGMGHVLETPDVAQGLVALAAAGARLDEARNQDGFSALDLLVQRIPTDLPPTALSALRSEVPSLQWDLRPPQGGPSPLERLQTLTLGMDSLMDRVQNGYLREFLDEEEHRLLTRAAEAATSHGAAPAVRSRARL